MPVQVPPPAARRSNRTDATPEPASAESDATATDGPRTAAPPAGAVSEPVGAAVSTTHVCEAGVGSVLPAASVARTRNVWLPSASAEYAFGLAHGANPAPSSSQAKLEPGSLEANEKLAAVAFVSAGGPKSMVVSGGVVS